LQYAPPELLGRLPGVKPGPSGDVYAFGKTCSFALFGTPEPRLRHWRSIPPEVAEVLEKCVEEDLQDRSADADRPAGHSESVGQAASRFRKAFVSYSSNDRAEVLRRVQVLRPPLTDIEIFQDMLDLQPGEKWDEVLSRRIDECDIFLLLWSSHAQQSREVRREVQRARQRQGPTGSRHPRSSQSSSRSPRRCPRRQN
jgi:hypothetical protein